jgi:hypothetical protein
MESYKSRVKIEVLMSLGIDNSELVTKDTELDIRIVQASRKILPKIEKIVHFYAYGCEETLEEIADHVTSAIKKDYDTEVIRRYINRAIDRLGEFAKSSREIQGWVEEYQKSQEKS